jgi:hypothetical protein
MTQSNRSTPGKKKGSTENTGATCRKTSKEQGQHRLVSRGWPGLGTDVEVHLDDSWDLKAGWKQDALGGQGQTLGYLLLHR